MQIDARSVKASGLLLSPAVSVCGDLWNASAAETICPLGAGVAVTANQS